MAICVVGCEEDLKVCIGSRVVIDQQISAAVAIPVDRYNAIIEDARLRWHPSEIPGREATRLLIRPRIEDPWDSLAVGDTPVGVVNVRSAVAVEVCNNVKWNVISGNRRKGFGSVWMIGRFAISRGAVTPSEHRGGLAGSNGIVLGKSALRDA